MRVHDNWETGADVLNCTRTKNSSALGYDNSFKIIGDLLYTCLNIQTSDTIHNNTSKENSEVYSSMFF